MEAALLGAPMVVIYRVKASTAAIVKHLIRTPFIGMVNLIAGREVAPELIQDGSLPKLSNRTSDRYSIRPKHERKQWQACRSEGETRAGRRDRACCGHFCGDVVTFLAGATSGVESVSEGDRDSRRLKRYLFLLKFSRTIHRLPARISQFSRRL